MRRLSFLVTTTIVGTLLAHGSAAFATDGKAPTSAQTASTTEVIGDMTDALAERGDVAAVSVSSDVKTDLPSRASRPAAVTTDEGTLTLRAPARGRDLAPSSDTTAVFDGAAPDTTVVVQNAGGLRALVSIDSPDAPERFAFPLGGDVAALRPAFGGAVDALNAEGDVIATAAAPWAVDANGVSVPTHYEIDGTTLSQVVEHRGGRFAYGIVADPCFSCILSTAWKVTKCASAITLAVAGVAVPLAKVAKIKRLVKEVGGVRKLAGRVVKVAKGDGKLSTRIKTVFSDLGTSVVALAAEVLGIQAIADECF